MCLWKPRLKEMKTRLKIIVHYTRPHGWWVVDGTSQYKLKGHWAIFPSLSSQAMEWSSSKEMTCAISNEANLSSLMDESHASLSWVFILHFIPTRERIPPNWYFKICLKICFFPYYWKVEMFPRGKKQTNKTNEQTNNWYIPRILFLFRIVIKRNCWQYKVWNNC